MHYKLPDVFTLDTCQCVCCCCCCGLVACGKCHVYDMCCMCCSCYSNPKSSGWVNGCMNEWVGEWVWASTATPPPLLFAQSCRVSTSLHFITTAEMRLWACSSAKCSCSKKCPLPLFLAPYSSQQSALHTRTQRGRERESRLCHIVWANRQVALSGAPQLQYQQKPLSLFHPRTNHTHQTVIQYL